MLDLRNGYFLFGTRDGCCILWHLEGIVAVVRITSVPIVFIEMIGRGRGAFVATAGANGSICFWSLNPEFKFEHWSYSRASTAGTPTCVRWLPKRRDVWTPILMVWTSLQEMTLIRDSRLIGQPGAGSWVEKTLRAPFFVCDVAFLPSRQIRGAFACTDGDLRIFQISPDGHTSILARIAAQSESIVFGAKHLVSTGALLRYAYCCPQPFIHDLFHPHVHSSC